MLKKKWKEVEEKKPKNLKREIIKREINKNEDIINPNKNDYYEYKEEIKVKIRVEDIKKPEDR